MSDTVEIEVGQTESSFRLWLATEARRQSELRLAAQGTALAALETRATAILQWSVAIILGLMAARTQEWKALSYIPAVVFLLVAALSCVVALWPKDWSPPGYAIDALNAMGHQTELEMAEATALGYQVGIQANDDATRRFALCLRVAWVSFCAAPLVAVLLVLFLNR